MNDLIQHHLDEFLNDGFTVMRAVFTPGEVAKMLTANERIVEKVRLNPDRYGTRFTSREFGMVDTWGVNNIFEPALYEPDLAQIFGHQGFMELSHRVLGPTLRFWSAHSLWSPEKVAYELNWHKDNYEIEQYHPAGRPTHVQFNVCLTEDSSFHALPGSHRRPVTEQERLQIESFSFDPLPGEVVAHCQPGDVIYMNYHMVHRGSCATKAPRRTLHMNVQSQQEPTGGQVSWGYMRQPGYLEGVEPALAVLMKRAIEWDDHHPIDRAEAKRRLRVRQDVRNHTAGASEQAR